jgi:hypothetical protein
MSEPWAARLAVLKRAVREQICLDHPGRGLLRTER